MDIIVKKINKILDEKGKERYDRNIKRRKRKRIVECKINLNEKWNGKEIKLKEERKGTRVQ